MMDYSTLDAHVRQFCRQSPDELVGLGAVLALTFCQEKVAIPPTIITKAEYLSSQMNLIALNTLSELVWFNLPTITNKTGTTDFHPQRNSFLIREMLASMRPFNLEDFPNEEIH